MLETDMTSFINNLKFGDKFTMPCHEGDTYVAIVQSTDDEYIYYIDEYNEEIQYIEKDSGVIYPYQEPIGEEKLDELAKNSEFNDLYNGVNHNPVDISYIEGFKAGYKKAMGEE